MSLVAKAGKKAGKKPASRSKLYKVGISEASGQQLTATLDRIELAKQRFNASVGALLTENAPASLLADVDGIQFLGVKKTPEGKYELHVKGK